MDKINIEQMTEEEKVEWLLPYVKNIASNIVHKTPIQISFDELYSEAQYVLLLAIRNFNNSKMNSLKNYVCTRVHVHLGHYVHKATTGRAHKGKNQVVVKMSSFDNRYGKYKDRFVCPNELPYKTVENRDLVEYFINLLPMKYKQIYFLRFTKHHTMNEIGKILGVSRARVSQIFQNTVNFLRERF